MKPLLSDKQLAAIQQAGRTSMRVPVVIKRPVFTEGSLGDDAVDLNPQTVVQPSSVLVSGTLLGYLRQTGGDVAGGIDVGRIQTTSTFELGLPIGANVRVRDRAIVAGESYVVENVLGVETWPAMLNCILRLGS